MLREVKSGADVSVTRGTLHEPVAAIVPIATYQTKKESTLGSLGHWGRIVFHDDWAVTDEELLAS